MTLKIVSPLEKFYEWEQKIPNKTFLRQAYKGQWHHTTWKKAGEEIRKMAAALRALNLPPQSKIALISKNCGHWIMADLAIIIPAQTSDRIQEVHIKVLHIAIEAVERALFPANYGGKG